MRLHTCVHTPRVSCCPAGLKTDIAARQSERDAAKQALRSAEQRLRQVQQEHRVALAELEERLEMVQPGLDAANTRIMQLNGEVEHLTEELAGALHNRDRGHDAEVRCGRGRGWWL